MALAQIHDISGTCSLNCPFSTSMSFVAVTHYPFQFSCSGSLSWTFHELYICFPFYCLWLMYYILLASFKHHIHVFLWQDSCCLSDKKLNYYIACCIFDDCFHRIRVFYFQGSKHVYKRYLRPFFLKHQAKIDRFLNILSKEFVSVFTMHLIDIVVHGYILMKVILYKTRWSLWAAMKMKFVL